MKINYMIINKKSAKKALYVCTAGRNQARNQIADLQIQSTKVVQLQLCYSMQ
jgi:hypothetical protein